ncbi:MAG: hypothetical protein AAGJ38_02425 [Planctomycetota bacterium]
MIDACRVVFDTQRQAGIDLPADGELYRFDINHPETNGMIELFIRPMSFRAKPAAAVDAPLGEGSLDLLSVCQRAAAVAGVERIRYVHPDRGFWMLPRSVSDAKIPNLVSGRDLLQGTS